MGTVALDSDVIIGFLDPGNVQHSKAVEALKPWLTAENSLLIAASVYAEILVQPMRVGLEETIDAFIADSRIQVVSIDRSIARRAAALRAQHEALRLPDALALATALERDAMFVTLDERLRRVIERLR